MATTIITPEMQRANAEVLLGKDPSKHRDPGQRWTATRYKELLRQIKQTEADKPVTILNMNPFPLKINGGVYFPDEIAACPPGKPYTIHVLRETRWGHRDLGCDAQNVMQMEPVPVLPMVQAAEYIREFVQQDGGFGGVICYVGDADPATFNKATIIRVPMVRYDENGELYIEMQDQGFVDMYNAVTKKQNASLLARLQSANSWYENDSQRMNVNDQHRDIARLALERNLIKELPRWVLQANATDVVTAPPCPSCMDVPAVGAFMCRNCGHVLNVLEAYKHARISYGSLDFDRLTKKEWDEATAIKAERDKARGQR